MAKVMIQIEVSYPDVLDEGVVEEYVNAVVQTGLFHNGDKLRKEYGHLTIGEANVAPEEPRWRCERCGQAHHVSPSCPRDGSTNGHWVA